ncbi:recombinase family protein, partial [Solidesulfovibrio aerotolerans]|uniref:recombinase family protein n=1 Tax=Solidesulfovibrio aerotolerans TaxID=295255 RepID=UPI003F6DD64A
DQNPERQLEHVQVDKVFTDKASGKDTRRPQLDALLAFVREGDRPVLDAACLEEIDREVIAILRRPWSFPTPEEAGRLGSLFHDDNNGTDTGGIICSDPCRAAFREGGLEKLYNSNAYWPQGIIGLESPGLIEHIFALKHRLELP